MEKDIYILLIYKQLDNEISETELKQLNSWLSENRDNQALADDLTLAYGASADYLESEAAAIDVDAAFAAQMELIEAETPENVISISKGKSNRNRFFRIISAAAAVFVLAIIAFQFLNIPEASPEITLVTADKSEMVILPDGSEVIVSPNSEIVYPKEFTEDRLVKLVKGEATFSIVKVEGSTFQVKTVRELVTVMGTIFEVKFGESQSKITVQEGKVKVRQNAKKEGQTDFKSVILTIGESVISTKNSLVKTKIENEESINYFEFQETNLKTIAANLAYHFNTTVLINSNLENCRLTVTFDGQSLEEVLMILDKLLGSEHRKNGDGFEVFGEGCE